MILVAGESLVDLLVRRDGAGDAFGAGFLAAWARSGHDRSELADLTALMAAARFAIAVATWSAGRAGADPPTLADLGDLGELGELAPG